MSFKSFSHAFGRNSAESIEVGEFRKADYYNQGYCLILWAVASSPRTSVATNPSRMRVMKVFHGFVVSSEAVAISSIGNKNANCSEGGDGHRRSIERAGQKVSQLPTIKVSCFFTYFLRCNMLDYSGLIKKIYCSL